MLFIAQELNHSFCANSEIREMAHMRCAFKDSMNEATDSEFNIYF